MTEKNFFDALHCSQEGQQYLKLIALAQSRNLPLDWERGFERHHIHPRGLGGSLELSNVIKLSTFEHVLAHVYLAKAIPCSQTLKPIVKLSGQQYLKLSDLEQLTLETVHKWSSLREKALHMPRSDEFKQKLSALLRGKPKIARENFGKSRVGKVFINNGVREKFIDPSELDQYAQEGWTKGRKPRPKEWSKKHGDTIRGTKLSEEHRKKIGAGLSKAKRGKICVHRGNEVRYISKESLEQYIEEGFTLGRGCNFHKS